jgi:FkbM family methyltransferase
MSLTEKLPSSKWKYAELLGEKQAAEILHLFSEIESGKYQKDEIHTVHIKGIKHPVSLRAIRADMQSFINTFIDPYLELKPYMKDTRTVIDAGANIGYTAILFANWWPQAKIIGIEADRENYELALKNIGPYSNITLLHGGLWNKEIQLSIEAGQEDGFVVREISNAQNGVSPENLTTGISLEQLLRTYSLPQIDFLKMNIEGSEKEVFSENYHTWLPKTKAMLVELHDGKNAGCSTTVFSAIAPYGFAIAETAPYGVLMVEESVYRAWYAKWYKEEIYNPNISKERFPQFYLDKEINSRPRK